MLEQIASAFEAAFTLWNLIAICGGIVLGIVIGAIPGLGSVTAMAVLIPVTYYMSPLAAIAFLVGVNKGGTSGGAIPAILLNSPGTPEAAATALDGHPMAKRGEAKRALKFAIFSSVTGDMISDGMLILLVVPFAAVALQFGPLEYTCVLLFAFALLAGITGDSPLKGIIAIFLGVFLATVGLDPVHSSQRMTFGQVNLYDGLSLTSLAIGALALSSVVIEMLGLGRSGGRESFSLEQPRSGAATALPFREFFSYWRTILRSSMIGSFVGMLPGLGVTLAAFLSYGAARRASPNRDRFGTGEPEGIIATEAANSAVVGANLVPTIALGIPGNIAAALLIGALVMHGIVPGPFMLTLHGDLVYGLFASMIIANVIHLVVGRLGVNLWVQFAVIPRGVILPPVILFCIIGVYLPSQSLWDVGVMLIFAGIGVAMARTGFSLVCLVIGFLLGDLFETSLRQTLLLYNGKYVEAILSPVALLFMALTIGVMVRAFIMARRKNA
ncbi:tripartite tricarboxylate transporter permease [Neptunicoccus cionae]|uniref:tripartite tricarboxylate transporter permease n=1 Tax=Neptunicoccus cionae TaxID=2035344 RepID=UPI000C792073|nr:tripartite tricarboxylate transporter permease [Amylibacter cionae]PLS21173.1 Tricarboxylate transporter family protein [Amylibacter cionae]